MTCGVLVRATRCLSSGLVLLCMLRASSTQLQGVADQVQGSEDPVAEEQRPH
jgi:hypothetical protein